MIRTNNKTVKKIARLVHEEFLTMGASDKRVAALKKIERQFKKAYKVKVEVKYVDGKYNITASRGYHHRRGVVVVYVTNDLRANTKTLLHELTHAYQYQFMNKKFMASTKAMAAGKVTYKNSWHETHARHTADILIEGQIGKIAIEDSFNYAIVA